MKSTIEINVENNSLDGVNGEEFASFLEQKLSAVYNAEVEVNVCQCTASTLEVSEDLEQDKDEISALQNEFWKQFLETLN